MPKRATPSIGRSLAKAKVKKNILPVSTATSIVESGNLNTEVALLADFEKLHVEVPDLLNILPIENNLWYPDFESKEDSYSLFKILKVFRNSIEPSPLLEDSVIFQFSKLFPNRKDAHLMNILAIGTWKHQRMHYLLYQVKEWRSREMLKNQVRIILDRRESRVKRQENENELQECLNWRTRRMAEVIFGRANTLSYKNDCWNWTYEENEKKAKIKYEKLEYGNKEKMLAAVREWHTNLQTKVSNFENNIRRLANPPFNYQKLDPQVLTVSIDRMKEDLERGTFSWIQKYSVEELGNLETKKYTDVEYALLTSMFERFKDLHKTVQTKSADLQVEKNTCEGHQEEANKTRKNNQAKFYQKLREVEEENSEKERELEKKILQLRRRVAKLSN